ncbi:MAG: hypothetical protein ABI273_05715 [Lacunisphaera sp.]
MNTAFNQNFSPLGLRDDQSPKYSAGGCSERVHSEGLVPELIDSAGACSHRSDKHLTRGELASVFAVSSRTIYRWSKCFSLPFVQRNARVIRYPMDAVILLSARGIALNRENAVRMGLVPEVIFAVAAKHHQLSQRNSTETVCLPKSHDSVLLAESDDDFRLIELRQHPERGETLRALVRMIGAV